MHDADRQARSTWFERQSCAAEQAGRRGRIPGASSGEPIRDECEKGLGVLAEHLGVLRPLQLSSEELLGRVATPGFAPFSVAAAGLIGVLLPGSSRKVSLRQPSEGQPSPPAGPRVKRVAETVPEEVAGQYDEENGGSREEHVARGARNVALGL